MVSGAEEILQSEEDEVLGGVRRRDIGDLGKHQCGGKEDGAL